jgi:NTE family protein
MADVAGKALVLGGGGITGIAWEIGMLAGLAERGIDLTDADLVIGTSAGSVVGVDVRSGTPLADLYAAQTRPRAATEVNARMSRVLMAKYVWAIAFTKKPQVARARVGALALRARTEPEDTRRRVIESRLPVSDWPAGKLQVTALEAGSGEFTVFDAATGVRLVDAVGASCAVPGIWPPVTIDGRRYIDGGMRSPANADLAAGFERVVVVAPLTRGFGTLESVASQASRLAEQGARVVVIQPEKTALEGIGKNVLDPAHRPAAARAGYAQAAEAAEAVKSVWL